MSDWLVDFFDRVVAINLDRRPDRWERLQQNLGTVDWPFRAPVRFPAVDGDATGVPPWWRQGGGAWGCLMSHARILEDCIREGVKAVLIIEDDALFVNDVRARAESFLREIPADWDQLYFGGQHLKPPKRRSDAVFECANVNRTHAYAVSRKFMTRMYRHILNAPDYIMNPGNHVDHRLGAMQETGTVNAYAPADWIAGQAGGSSNVSGRVNTEIFWDTFVVVPDMTMNVILGLHDGAAHEVARLLVQTGVHFGYNLGGFRSPPVEDVGLSHICERVFPFPSSERKLRVEESAPLIHDWCWMILQEATNRGTVGAACYPSALAMRDDFLRAWRKVRVIDVRDNLDVAVEQLFQRTGNRNGGGGFRATREEIVALQTSLAACRAEWLASCEHITVEPARLLSDRAALAEELREFLHLKRPS